MQDRDSIARRYVRVRAQTEALTAPLSAEDAMVQSMPDASPAKWHLAHTTWFFEEFVLVRFHQGRWPDERWRVLFNSYYEAVGPRHARSARGMLSRPSLDEVLRWRHSVDERMLALLATVGDAAMASTLLGIHHEEQHQELILTDIKHAFSSNPIHPPYTRTPPPMPAGPASPLAWLGFEERVVDVGNRGHSFAFDNEMPCHREIVGAFAIASRLVTNAEYAAFVEDRGYERPELWLADGWSASQSAQWRAPLYWERQRNDDARSLPPGTPTANDWSVFGLRGLCTLDPDAPVSHVSFYEADAYARWTGVRLPTEQEWESVAEERCVEGNFVETGVLTPTRAACSGLAQIFGDAWEWTASAYSAYPRFRPLQGPLGEYNGKFMSGQMVLRGGSCFSPREHLRATYRNFFPPSARWQMSGVRLARDS